MKKDIGFLPGTSVSTIYKWLFYQLDDEPNLYIENGWKSPNIHLQMVGLGVPGTLFDLIDCDRFPTIDFL